MSGSTILLFSGFFCMGVAIIAGLSAVFLFRRAKRRLQAQLKLDYGER